MNEQLTSKTSDETRLQQARRRCKTADGNPSKSDYTICTLADEVERLRVLLNARPPYYCPQCDCGRCGNTRPADEKSRGPELRPDSPDIQYSDVFKAMEAGEAVDTQDCLNALWWKVGNQRREIARLHAKRTAPETSGGWIRVKDRLPPLPESRVLVWFSNGRFGVTTFYAPYPGHPGEFISPSLEPHVTHWQPIPTGPRSPEETDARCPATRFTTDDLPCTLPAAHAGDHDYVGSPSEQSAFERGCYALMEMMQAYERRVRTDCLTPEDLAKRPWECAEYIKAANYLRSVWPISGEGR